jgi:hypothetical protein
MRIRYCRLTGLGWFRCFLFILVGRHIAILLMTIAIIIAILPGPEPVLRILPIDVIGTLIVIDHSHLHAALPKGILILIFFVVHRKHKLLVHQSHNGFFALGLWLVVFMGLGVGVHPGQ